MKLPAMSDVCSRSFFTRTSFANYPQIDLLSSGMEVYFGGKEIKFSIPAKIIVISGMGVTVRDSSEALKLLYNEMTAPQLKEIQVEEGWSIEIVRATVKRTDL